MAFEQGNKTNTLDLSVFLGCAVGHIFSITGTGIYSPGSPHAFNPAFMMLLGKAQKTLSATGIVGITPPKLLNVIQPLFAVVEITARVVVIATEVGAAESLPHGVLWVHSARCNGRKRYLRGRLVGRGVWSWLLSVGEFQMNFRYMDVLYILSFYYSLSIFMATLLLPRTSHIIRRQKVSVDAS